jgi:3',5'-cyclic AMP phosphodiesterase CpdA
MQAAMGLGLSAAGVLYLPALASPRKPVGPDHFAFLSDIHIREKPLRKIYTPDPFAKVIQQILALPELPTAAVVCGDCASLKGKSEDYKLLDQLLKPLREGGVPIYLILGNHDVRDALWKQFPKQKGKEGAFDEPKHIKVLSAPSVHLVMLDSKVTKDFTFGRLDKDQMAWLDAKLGELADRPVICMAHHGPNFPYSPLSDYDEMCAVFKKHPQAKAYFCGHAHEWYHQQHKEGKHWEVCIPSTAYAFKKKEPTGWLDVQFDPKGVKLTLHALDEKHPKHKKPVKLVWKS